MQLQTLGKLELEGSSFTQAKALLLLAYLAVEGPQERRRLAELFWFGSKDPLNTLSTTLNRVKQGAPGAVESDDVRAWTSIPCDAVELIEAHKNGEAEACIALYEGTFLEGVRPQDTSSELEEWFYSTREVLGARVRKALLELAEEHARGGEFPLGAELAERAYLLAGAPEPEPQELERLFVLLTAGEHGEAVEVQKEAVGYDLELSMSVEAARAALHQGKGSTKKEVRYNLPLQATRFVGRERELSEISEQLTEPECRLLSLVAAGGLGKTRLALQAAQQQLEGGSFDGVVFVPLEALRDAASFPAVVAGALGLTLSGQEDAREVVKRFLAKKRLLLVLDNFEHLLEGTTFVRDLIDHCPMLKLLITSRERLNLEPEWVFTIEGLAYPEEGTTLEHAVYFDALQLFLERAGHTQHGFSLTPDVLPAVVRICELVEGMPLAIELASGWLRALPAGEIVRELETGIDLLESPARDVPERHRGVRVVFDHSWSLLNEGEREVLRRLSVFRGGFTREAASVVAGATLPMLARLVDKSVLRMSPEGRYDRHPLLSQYTSEKLAEQPHEKEDAEQKHGSYYLGLVRELEPDLWTLERKEALMVFLGELANIRAAWDWATLNLKVDEIERTTPAMFDFFTIRLTEGLEYFGTTFEFFGSIAERLEESNPNHLGAMGTVLIHQVFEPTIMHRLPDYLQVRSVAERGIELLETLGEPRGLARGFVALGESFHFTEEPTESKEWFEQALAMARKHGSSSDIAYALQWLSHLSGHPTLWGSVGPENTSGLTRYGQFVQEGLEELRALNHLPGVAWFLDASANILASEQRFGEAKAVLWEGKRLAEELGHHELVIIALVSLAEASLGLGEVDQASAHAREAYRRVEETGLRLLLPNTLGVLGRVATAQGDFKGARELLLRSIEIAWAQKRRFKAFETLLDLAVLLAAEGNPGKAVAWLTMQMWWHWDRKDRVLAELEGSMTPKDFAEAMERGRGMILDDVVNELLPEL